MVGLEELRTTPFDPIFPGVEVQATFAGNLLAGDFISIPSRSNVYDALISKRVYKPPYPHTMSVHIIRKAKGTHFDPDIVDAFLEIHEQLRDIAIKFAE